MSLVSFDSLPDESRLWCFAASRSPDAAATAHLLDRVSLFLEDWTAHRQALNAAFDWRYQRFLLVAVDERAAGASGCSIDSLVARLRELEAELNLTLLDAAPVWYRDSAGHVRTALRADFRRLARDGVVGPGTTVFDLAVARLGELRGGRWELPAADSWHARLLADT
jgi:hypothetical protein